MYVRQSILSRCIILIGSMLTGCTLALTEVTPPSQSNASDSQSKTTASASQSIPLPTPTEKTSDFAPVFSYSRIIVTLLPHPNSIATISSDLEWHTVFKVLVETNRVGDIGNIAFKKKGTLADSAILAAKLWRSVKDDSQVGLDQRCGCFFKGAIISSGRVELKDGFIEFPLDPAHKMAYAFAGKEGSGVTIGLLLKIDSKNSIDDTTLGFDIQDDRRSFHAFASDRDGTLFEWPTMEYRGLPFEGPLVKIEKMFSKSASTSTEAS